MAPLIQLLATDDEGALAVGLVPDEAVDDMDAGLLELPRGEGSEVLDGHRVVQDVDVPERRVRKPEGSRGERRPGCRKFSGHSKVFTA